MSWAVPTTPGCDMSSRGPSYEDLQRALAATSRKMSDSIQVAYEVKEEMKVSIFRRRLDDDYRKAIERNRKAMKKDGK